MALTPAAICSFWEQRGKELSWKYNMRQVFGKENLKTIEPIQWLIISISKWSQYLIKESAR